MLSDEAIGLLVKIKGEADADEIKKFRNEVEDEIKQLKENGGSVFVDLAKSIGLSSSQTATLSAALPIAGTALTAVAGAATALTAVMVGAGFALFNLSKQASDYGSTIFDMSQKTGLSAETLSAVKFAADQSGASLETFSKGVKNFSLLIADAEKGSESAKNTLKSLGLEPQTALKSLDNSLATVISKIVEIKSPIAQAAIASEVFGRKVGTELLPFIKSFDGDMQKLIETAKELGVTIDDKAAAAADEFGDQLDTLTLQIAATGRMIGQEFMPIFLAMSKATSEWIVDNKGAIKTWASDITLEIKGLIAYWKELNDWIARYKVQTENPPADGWAEYFKNLDRLIIGDKAAKFNEQYPAFSPSWNEGKIQRQKLIDKGKEYDQNNPDIIAGSSEFIFDPAKELDFQKRLQEAEKRAKEAEDRARRDTAALIGIWRNYAGQADKIFDESYKNLQEKFKNSGNAEEFRTELQRIIQIFISEREKIDKFIGNLEKAQAQELNKTANERRLIEQKLTQDKQAWIDKYTKAQADSEKIITEGAKKETEKRVKLSEDEANRKIERIKSDAELAVSERNAALNADLQRIANYKKSEKDFSDSMLIQIADISTTEQRSQIERNLETEKFLGARFTLLEESLQRELFTEIKHAETVGKIKLDALENERKTLLSITQTDENRAQIQQKIRLLDNQIAQQKIDNEKAVEEAQNKQLSREQKEVDLLMQNLETRQKIQDQINSQQPPPSVRPGYDENGNQTTTAPEGVFSGWKAMWSEFITQIEKDSVGVGNVVTQMAGLFINAFDGMTRSVGRAIENWALYGGSVGKALRQALAAELAHIAGVATVKALYATALGFIRLAEFNFPAAGWAFLSAGMWAALAGGTALAARAIAPKNDNAVANAGLRQSAGGSSSGSYDSVNDSAKVIELGRQNAYQSQPQKMTIKYVGDNIFAEMFKIEFNQNGQLREFLLKEIGD